MPVINCKAKKDWEVKEHHSEWIRGFSAGGCGNPPHQGSHADQCKI